MSVGYVTLSTRFYFTDRHLGDSQFRRSGFEEDTWFEEDIWKDLAKKHSSEGYSVKVANIFGVQFTNFPCLIIFRHIRLPEHVVITLTAKTAEQIADQMRSVFSVIQEATSSKQDSLKALERHLSIEEARKAGQGIINVIRSVSGKTFETAMQAIIKAYIG